MQVRAPHTSLLCKITPFSHSCRPWWKRGAHPPCCIAIPVSLHGWSHVCSTHSRHRHTPSDVAYPSSFPHCHFIPRSRRSCPSVHLHRHGRHYVSLLWSLSLYDLLFLFPLSITCSFSLSSITSSPSLYLLFLPLYVFVFASQFLYSLSLPVCI